MFDLHRLRMLRELARLGTVTAAAEALTLSPSAVSQQLALLQREAGSVLFVRQGRRLRLTDAGRLLAEHADRLLADAERARAELAALAGSVSGPVRLSAFPTAARNLVPGAVARCRAAHPELRIIMDEREPDDSFGALAGHETDVALVHAYGLLSPLRAPGITLSTLFEEPFVMLLPPDHPYGDGPVPLAALADATWVATYSDTAGRGALDRACARAGFAPRVDFASNDYAVIMALVEAGLGVALVPRIAAPHGGGPPGDAPHVAAPPRDAPHEGGSHGGTPRGDAPYGGGPCVVGVAGEPVTRRIQLAVRDGAAGHPAVRALSSALIAQANDIPAFEM
ncbi:MAG TPA: LysR family transcriptional regulator [Streptosporangiaceae bacterium]